MRMSAPQQRPFESILIERGCFEASRCEMTRLLLPELTVLPFSFVILTDAIL